MNPALNKFDLVILRKKGRRGETESVQWINLFRVDRRIVPTGVVDYRQLVRSLTEEGEFHLFTCGCGEAGCAGIHGGIEVRHRKGRTSWRMNCENPLREFLFDTAQYQQAVCQGLLRWRKQVTQKRGWLQLGPVSFDRDQLDDCVRLAESACAEAGS